MLKTHPIVGRDDPGAPQHRTTTLRKSHMVYAHPPVPRRTPLCPGAFPPAKHPPTRAIPYGSPLPPTQNRAYFVSFSAASPTATGRLSFVISTTRITLSSGLSVLMLAPE